MKILYTKDLIREAGLKDWIVEKSNGLYNKIRDVFRGSDSVNEENYAEEMIDEIKDESFEQQTAAEINEGSSEYESISPSSISGLTKAQKIAVNAINTQSKVKIGYLTKDYNTYIIRNITPLYTYRARVTRNNILVAISHEANDYRAFIINNIVSAQIN